MLYVICISVGPNGTWIANRQKVYDLEYDIKYIAAKTQARHTLRSHRIPKFHDREPAPVENLGQGNH
jgi:hypothetical protein